MGGPSSDQLAQVSRSEANAANEALQNQLAMDQRSGGALADANNGQFGQAGEVGNPNSPLSGFAGLNDANAAALAGGMPPDSELASQLDRVADRMNEKLGISPIEGDLNNPNASTLGGMYGLPPGVGNLSEASPLANTVANGEFVSNNIFDANARESLSLHGGMPEIQPLSALNSGDLSNQIPLSSTGFDSSARDPFSGVNSALPMASLNPAEMPNLSMADLSTPNLGAPNLEMQGINPALGSNAGFESMARDASSMSGVSPAVPMTAVNSPEIPNIPLQPIDSVVNSGAGLANPAPDLSSLSALSAGSAMAGFSSAGASDHHARESVSQNAVSHSSYVQHGDQSSQSIVNYSQQAAQNQAVEYAQQQAAQNQAVEYAQQQQAAQNQAVEYAQQQAVQNQAVEYAQQQAVQQEVAQNQAYDNAYAYAQQQRDSLNVDAGYTQQIADYSSAQAAYAQQLTDYNTAQAAYAQQPVDNSTQTVYQDYSSQHQAAPVDSYAAQNADSGVAPTVIFGGTSYQSNSDAYASNQVQQPQYDASLASSPAPPQQPQEVNVAASSTARPQPQNQVTQAAAGGLVAGFASAFAKNGLGRSSQGYASSPQPMARPAVSGPPPASKIAGEKVTDASTHDQLLGRTRGKGKVWSEKEQEEFLKNAWENRKDV